MNFFHLTDTVTKIAICRYNRWYHPSAYCTNIICQEDVIPSPDTGSLYNDVVPVALSCHPSTGIQLYLTIFLVGHFIENVCSFRINFPGSQYWDDTFLYGIKLQCFYSKRWNDTFPYGIKLQFLYSKHWNPVFLTKNTSFYNAKPILTKPNSLLAILIQVLV